MSLPYHICHLTVLNPLLHSRIYFKEALSQRRAGYRVTIIGQGEGPSKMDEHGVGLLPTGVFGRLSPKRFRIGKKILELALLQKADFYIVHTPELLSIAKKIRAKLPEARIVYDMHEDYMKNIVFGGHYPELLKRKLAAGVREREVNFCEWGSGLMLAEECFESILPFDGERTTLVRNMFQKPENIIAPQPMANNYPTLLFSGTIAESWGMKEALQLWKKVNEKIPVNLAVAGHGQDADFLYTIENEVKASGLSGRFVMDGGRNYQPYEKIVGWIRKADAVLAPYHLRENIKDRIPTKFYEAMAFRKPVIFTRNESWDQLNARLDFGKNIGQKINQKDVQTVVDLLSGKLKCYRKEITENDFSWHSQEKNMLNLLERLKRND